MDDDPRSGIIVLQYRLVLRLGIAFVFRPVSFKLRRSAPSRIRAIGACSRYLRTVEGVILPRGGFTVLPVGGPAGRHNFPFQWLTPPVGDFDLTLHLPAWF